MPLLYPWQNLVKCRTEFTLTVHTYGNLAITTIISYLASLADEDRYLLVLCGPRIQMCVVINNPPWDGVEPTLTKRAWWQLRYPNSQFYFYTLIFKKLKFFWLYTVYLLVLFIFINELFSVCVAWIIFFLCSCVIQQHLPISSNNLVLTN